MDNLSDIYANDQYHVDMTPPYTPNSTLVPSDGAIGYYEDKLRFDQYAIPMNLRCLDPNPYIQDPISKSQRHQPIRTASVPARKTVIAETDCEPGLAGYPQFMASNQRMQLTPAESPKKAKKKSGGNSAAQNKESFGGFELDSMTILILFVFVVLMFMCMYYWKSLSDMKDTLKSIKSLIKQKA